MTATDRAFIRVFDELPERADLAPHVLFAARGVQMSKTIAAADALAGPGAGLAARRSPEPEQRRMTSAAIEATGMTSRSRSSPRQDRESRSTYLPSAFRNLVGIDETEASPVGPRFAVFDKAELADKQTDELDAHALDRKTTPMPGHEAGGIAEFRPALEVDALRWPAVVTRLISQNAQELGILGDALRQSIDKEQRVIALQSASRGAGCTTVALASARLMASQGYSVGIVDADLHRPGLATAVGLVIEEGWESTLFSEAPISEAVIRSLSDGIAIVPLATPYQEQLSRTALPSRAAAAFHVLAENFDVVLLDSGCSTELLASLDTRTGQPAAADACVLVYAFDPHAHAADLPQLDLSLPLIGVVENLAVTGAA
jgi:Mrp family chromosome partitioning ATPase